MPRKDLLKIKRKLDKMIEKGEKEALDEGMNLLSAEFVEMIEQIKNKILIEAGVSLDEFSTFETAMEIDPDKIDREMLSKLIEEIDNKIKTINDKVENVSKMKGPIGERGIRGDKGDSIRGERGKNGIDGERGRDGKTMIALRGKQGKPGNDANVKSIRREFEELSSKVNAFGENFEHNIDIVSQTQRSMPDFRKLAMGLRGDIDANKATVGTFVDDETPTGTVNSSNKVFTLSNTPKTNSLKVFVNGQRVKGGGEDYTLSGVTITFVTAPPTTSILTVDYRK